MLSASNNSVLSIFDIDNGYKSGDEKIWASSISIVNADGDQIASGSGDASKGGGGSDTAYDDYLKYSFTQAGTYYIKITNWLNNGGVPSGVDYELNVSLENHSVATFVFKPQPVLDDDSKNSDENGAGQLLEQNNFFNFYDEEVQGSKDIPYARIIGSGDGTYDIYSFVVTPQMLNPIGNTTPTGTESTDAFFTEIVIHINPEDKTLIPGEVWSIGLRHVDYSYTVQSGNDASHYASQVATNLVAAINATDSAFKESGGSASVVVDDNTKITISNPNGFNLKGSGGAIGLSQSISGAGLIKETITLKDKIGSDAQFGQVTLEFSGTPENEDVISIILVLDGNTTTIVTDPSSLGSLTSIVTNLKDKINAINTFTASESGTSITIAKTGFGATDINVGNGVGLDSGFTISYQAKGKDNAPTVDFKNAVLVESSLKVTEVTEYSVELKGDVREGEEWALTLGGNAYTYVVESGVTTLSALAEKLKDEIGTAYTVNVQDSTLTIGSSGAFSFGGLVVTPSGTVAINSNSSATSQTIILSGDLIAVAEKDGSSLLPG